MKCPKCEAEVGEDDNFCGECGAELRGEVEAKSVKPEIIPGKADKSPDSGENIKGLLCYLFTWVSGIIFLLTEKKSKFVRFHAIQSIAAFILLSIPIGLWEVLLANGYFYLGDFPIFVLLNQHPLIPMFFILIDEPDAFNILYMSFLSFFIWIFLMYNAYKGKTYKLPLVGDFAEKYS